MLETLRKALGGKEAVKPVETLEIKLDTAEIQAAIQAAVTEVKAEFDTYKQTADAAMAEAAEKLNTLQAELAEMAGKLTEAQAALVAADTAKLDAANLAAALKLSARKEKLVASIGTERADALMQATEGMEDAAFEAVAAALGVGIEAESKSELFTEVGTDAQADGSKVTESKEMQILRAKYKHSGK